MINVASDKRLKHPDKRQLTLINYKQYLGIIITSIKKSRGNNMLNFDYKKDHLITQFKGLASLDGKRAIGNKRFNNYIIVLDIPNVPRRHPGIDDSCHPFLPIAQDHIELLEGAKRVFNVISKEKKGSTCPNSIFLRNPISENDDPVTQEIHRTHTLDTYKSTIENESQHPITFHLSGHGNLEGVGSIHRFSPKEFAKTLDLCIESSDLKKILLSKKQPLVFHFHVCNAGYVEFEPNETEDSLKNKVLNESVMGRFYQKMKKLGYINIKVIGYRGYYQAMNNGSGIRLATDRDGHNSLSSSHGLYSIESTIDGREKITIPDFKKANFEVEGLEVDRQSMRLD